MVLIKHSLSEKRNKKVIGNPITFLIIKKLMPKLLSVVFQLFNEG